MMLVADKKMNDTLKILIVDDEENARVMLKQLITLMGHHPVLARNGLEAVHLFASEAPDIVLMDVMMPELDGFKATARIRQLDPEKWVPVVFLSALEQSGNLRAGLDAGGDDYIVKPVNLVDLQAKIRALQRVTVLQRTIAAKTAQLEYYYQQAEEEARIGSHLMDRLTSKAGLQDQALQYWTRPLQRFNGDLVAAARTPGNVLHVMVADAVGHGLPAALNTLPLAEAFYDMTGWGFSLVRIIREMNRKIKELFPLDRFVTATLASVDVYNREVQVWNGGNPTPIFVDASGRVRGIANSNQLPLGLLDENSADIQPEVMVCQEAGQLVMFTDGLYEAQGANGSYWGCAGILDVLARAPREKRFEQILAEFERHLGKRPIQDDASLMLVDVSYQSAQPAHELPSAGAPVLLAENTLGWEVRFRFSARELKTLDVIPFLTTIVEKLESSKEHRRQIFMILSELFNNALEHGLLQLDSRIKSTHQGFEAYMHERSSRLHRLDEGSIEVALERAALEGKTAIRIHVKDSGKGFDYNAIDPDNPSSPPKPYGRGILLVKGLSHDLRYLGAGNEVVSYYCL